MTEVKKGVTPSVEWLVATIKRATDEEHAEWSYHAWDVEYAEDMLNDWLPGLGDAVAKLPHDYEHEQRYA